MFSTLSGKESSQTKVSDNVIARTEDEFKLVFKKEEALDEEKMRQLLADYQSAGSSRSSFRLVAEESAQETEKLIQKAELGDLTGPQLLGLLAQAKKSGDPKAIDALYLKFKALIYLQPEICGELGQVLASEEGNSKTMGMLATALSTIGSPEAQKALVTALDVRREDIAAIQVLIPALGMTEHPSLESEDALKSLIQNSKKEEVVTTAGLSLGIMASHLADDAPERHQRIVEGIQNDYQRAETSEQKKFLLSILGNAGSESSLPALSEALNSPDPSLQAEAAMAMRFVPGKEVDDRLLKVLKDNVDESVKDSAASALGYREPTQDLSNRMKAAFTAEKSERVRRELIKDVYEFRAVDPQVKDWLKWVKDNDPSNDVRQMAKDYYGLSTNQGVD